MNTNQPYDLPTLDTAFGDDETGSNPVPIHGIGAGESFEKIEGIGAAQLAWIKAHAFSGQAKQTLAVPRANGGIGAVLAGLGAGDSGEPCGPADLLAGALAKQLPAGVYRLGHGWTDKS